MQCSRHVEKTWDKTNVEIQKFSGVTGGGANRPEGKIFWANLQRIVDKRGSTGKKGAG